MRVRLHGVGVPLLLSLGILVGMGATAKASHPQMRKESAVREQRDFLLDTTATGSSLTKEQIMQMDYEELIELDLDILMDIANESGLSVDELMEMAMNRKATIASRKSESIFDSPLATYVISAEDIANSGYTQIPELFSMIPGALVRQKTNGNYDVTFHGMDNVPPENPMVVRENTTVLLMIDNRVVYDQFSGGIFWEALPISVNDIERIDVVMGAASALYGPNAMTGVINIITQKGSVRSGAKGWAAGGLDGKRDAMLNVAVPFSEAWSSRITAYLQHTDRFETDYYSYPATEKLPAEQLLNYKMQSPFISERSSRLQKLGLLRYGGTGNMYYTGKDKFSARFSGGAQYSRSQTAGFNNLVLPLNLRTSKSIFGSAVVNFHQLHAQANVAHNDFNLDEGVRTPYNPSFHTLSVDALVNGDFSVGYGLSFQPELSVRHTKAQDEASKKNFDPLRKNDDGSLGGYAQNYMAGEKGLSIASGSMRVEYKPIDQLRFIAAARYDVYAEIQRQALGWQAVAVYTPSPKHLIRANYSRASRSLFHTSLFADVQNVAIMNSTYSLYDVAGDASTAPPVMGVDNQFLSIAGNADLDIPIIDFFELGYRGNFGQYLQLDLSLFAQELRGLDAPGAENIAVELFNPDESNKNWVENTRAYYRFRNLGMKARQYGGTLSLSSTPTYWFSCRGDVTMQVSRLHHYEVANDVVFNYNMGANEGAYEFVKVNRTHYTTPALFGGLHFHFTPLRSKRLNINVNVNGMSNQIYTYAKVVRDSHPYLQQEIPWAIWADVSISFRVLPGVTLFATGQNLGETKMRYAFSDIVRPTAFGGFRLDF